MTYFKNRAYVKRNKGKHFSLKNFRKSIRIEGWNWFTGKIIIQVFDEISDTRRIVSCDYFDGLPEK